MGWDRLQALFEGALALPAEERSAYLDAECGNDRALRSQVEELLRSDEEADRFLRAPTGGGAVLSPTEDWSGPLHLEGDALDDPFLGRRIGAYEVRELVARGGMGAVYRADRVDGQFDQTVAVKILKRGLDTDEILRRFVIERQVLARLEHPHIARLYDGGATEEGLPYLTMELVDGESIDRFCDSRRLGVRERLALFIQICRAVQFAHQNLIVHRDLKPSNILVTPDGEPKLLDFGIAKVIDPEASGAEPIHTVTQMRLMTPRYASPEQVRGEPATTRTDVYSLGVILYELLCGRSPHVLRTTKLEEIERVICEVEPTRPSAALTRISGQTTERSETAAIAEARHTDVRRLRSLLSGDIETITLKALSKDAARRYDSPDRLADDLERYLGGHPVHARPDSVGYRLRKFTLRHIWALSIAAVFLVVVTVSTGLGLWQQFQMGLQGEEIARLADFKYVDEAVREAELLWPIDPAMLPRYDRWLERYGVPLRENEARHREMLAEVRARSIPETAADRAERQRQHPRFEELEQLRARLRIDRAALEDATAEEREARAAEIESRATMARSIEEEMDHEAPVEFAEDNQRDSLLHATLVRILDRLEPFLDPDPQRGVLASVEWRRDRAMEMATVEAERLDRWRGVREEIRRSDRYRGLDLPPQVGLWPLGWDADSGLAEFYDIRTGLAPSRGEDGGWQLEAETALIYVLLPGGKTRIGTEATAGSKRYDPLASPMEGSPGGDEGSWAPVEVELAPFFIGKFELTQPQWSRFAPNPSKYYVGYRYPEEGEAWVEVSKKIHPIETVSWEVSRRVLRRFGAELPTEAQWEYAARGRGEDPWPGCAGVAELGRFANVADRAYNRLMEQIWQRSVNHTEEVDDGFPLHSPVGEFEPNGFGLYDTLGNVSEWCRDPWGRYDAALFVGDEALQVHDLGRDRLHRGGSHRSEATLARVSARQPTPGTGVSAEIGVRCVRSLEFSP
ncbi:MAG: bifunctional serine/threonine-protein kinase/formylglycine-generating enzyme family protein [Planctomycetota bacterium]